MVHNIAHIICLRLLTAFLESDPRLHCFCKVSLAYPENKALLDEALSMLATKKNASSQGKYTSLSTLNKTFLSTFNFVPKVKEF